MLECFTTTATTGEYWHMQMWGYLDHGDHIARCSHLNLRKVRLPSFRLELHSRLTHSCHYPGIETEFAVVAAHRVASLHYHEWLPNDHFASSQLVDENQWMETSARWQRTFFYVNFSSTFLTYLMLFELFFGSNFYNFTT